MMLYPARGIAALALLGLGLSASAAQSPGALEDGDYVALARAHYQRVEQELRARDVSHLDAEQRANRAVLIDALSAYRERGLFGRNSDFPGARVPYFVDHDGRHCAVAHLMHVTGEDLAVARVASADNHVFVAELAGDAELAAWLEANGLALVEAARIQMPTGVPTMSKPGPWGPQPPAGPGIAAPNPPTPGAPDSPRSPSTGGPRAPAMPATPTTGGSTPSMPDNVLSAEADPWWIWWEMNKLDYMSANRLADRSYVPTGSSGAATPDVGKATRGSVAMQLLAELSHTSADVRAAAVVALARLRGEDSVLMLKRLLDDPNVTVREHTLLAIGAAGGDRAFELLVNVVRSGNASGQGRDEISPRARAVAIVALGLTRRQGLDEVQEDVLEELLRGTSQRPSDEVALAVMLHRTLAPAPAHDALAQRFAGGEFVGTLAQSRALETLRTSSDGKALPVLSRTLHGRRPDLRQSAALTIGELDHDLALPTLMTAFELEKEPTTRGFTLLAIGRRGGEGAREFLIDALQDERRSMGHWAALALGILARADDDELARAAIRDAYDAISDPEHRGAYLLALGIARDTAATPLAIRELSGSNQRTRMHAALCLGMIGDVSAREALLARLEVEAAELAQVGIVHALGTIGDPRDGAKLVEAMASMKNRDLQGVMAVAVSFHGSRDVLAGLQELPNRENLDTAGRAATWTALGMLLSPDPTIQLAELSRQSNFTLYPSWILELLQIAL